jgi:hypothetical protein
MKIDNFKDFEKLLKKCREYGVESIKVDGIEFYLGHMPEKQIKLNKSVNLNATNPGINQAITEDIKIPTDELTPEQLLFYSSIPHTDSN